MIGCHNDNRFAETTLWEVKQNDRCISLRGVESYLQGNPNFLFWVSGPDLTLKSISLSD